MGNQYAFKNCTVTLVTAHEAQIQDGVWTVADDPMFLAPSVMVGGSRFEVTWESFNLAKLNGQIHRK